MKTNRAKQLISSVLALVMLFALFTGCKPKDPGASDSPDFVYVPNYVDLPKEVTDINYSCLVGDTIFFTRYIPVYPDGSIVPQEDLEEYEKEIELYYSGLSAASGTNIGASTYARSYAVASPMPTTAPSLDIAIEDNEVATEDDVETAEGEMDIMPIDGEMNILPDIGMTPPDMGEYPEADFTYEYRLYSIKTDGTDLRFMEGYTPKKLEGVEEYYSGINKIISDGQGNLWILEQVREPYYNFPEGFDEENGNKWEHYNEKSTYYAIQISEAGEMLNNICLNDHIENVESISYFYLSGFAVDAEGNIYFDDNTANVYVLGPDGNLVTKLDYEGWINGYIRLGDGRVAVAQNSESGGTDIKTVDIAAKTWGDTYTLQNYIYDFLPGGDAYDFCYNNGTSLYGYDLETETETRIITWINNDIDGNQLQLCDVKENGDIFVITYNYNEEKGTNFEVANLVKTPAADVKTKTPISIAMLYMDYNIRESILKFNRTNPDFRIEVRDYSEYNTYGEGDNYNPNAGLLKLNTEIISGNVPDLIITGSIPYKQYAAKGLLVDLYGLLDSDPQLGREALVPGVLKAMESEGKLYTIASTFSVTAMIGNPDVVGADMNWTMQEFMEIIKAHPDADQPLGSYMTRENVFNQLCSLNIESYVNWITGECNFDSPEFKGVLEFAKSFPGDEEMDYENYEYVAESELIKSGRMLASFFYLSDFYNYQYYKAIYGGNIVFKGLPGDDSGAVAQIDSGIAMTTSCKNKDAAWEFMRTILTEDYQKNSWGFPTNQKAFDAKVKEATTQEYDSEGKPISRGGISDGTNNVEFYALTQEEADQVLGLINSIKHMSSYDTSLTDIINEDATAYFAGEKGLDETAALIQSRMRIYINEQR